MPYPHFKADAPSVRNVADATPQQQQKVALGREDSRVKGDAPKLTLSK